ncbi:MAG TPA: hypothetical protein RMH85_20695 [Polyangiaceae bacterium LLY-WYZ-15_(1-7)]|nr:hypothetical protein [Polyangiaceae bacterium LLY-WYZ-15_(1-7)]HJL10905.1 hypothetical protein [Polyangiaceae bacterium LLY-WYZ-15_(1-7)]
MAEPTSPKPTSSQPESEAPENEAPENDEPTSAGPTLTEPTPAEPTPAEPTPAEPPSDVPAARRSPAEPAARRTALGAAALAFAFAAPLAYVAQRLYERSVSGPVNPLLVLREAHTSFYWRCATAAWWGGLVAVAVFAAQRRQLRLTSPRRGWVWALAFALALGWVTWVKP